MTKYVFLLLAVLTSLLCAQDEKGFPELKTKDAPGIIIHRTSLYDGSSLWGLIDGGADIYLEYGFNSLMFQEVELNDVTLRVELYKMDSGNSAYGIFSVSRFKCSQEDTITKHICISQYQVQAAIGKFYISVSKSRNDAESNAVMLKLFTIILHKIKESPFALPSLFSNKALAEYKNRVKLIKGNLGMQNGFPEWTDLFDGFSKYDLYILPVENSAGYLTLAQVKFQNKNDADKFLEKLKGEPKKKVIKIFSPSEFIFTETNMKEEDCKKYIAHIK